MVVQHNLTAMNSNRMLGITTSAQAKSSEKLSSGYRINRAADDAAGLTISEKMRKQMRGLDRASTNAQDGVSAVQTAEGALTEVHSMLQRMNELANQASNGTNSTSDRDAIQAEIDQLTTEVDRVAETTKFNETYLLKGNADGTTSTKNVNAHDAGLAGKLVDNGNGTSSFALTKELKDGDKVTIAGKEYTIGTTGKGSVADPSTLNTKKDGYLKSNDAAFTTDKLKAGDSFSLDGKEYTITDKVSVDDLADFVDDDTVTIGDKTYTANGTADHANDVYTSDELKSMIKDALADGKQVSSNKFHVSTAYDGTTTATANGEVTVSHQIVSSLENGEISSASVKTALTDATAGTVQDYIQAAAGNKSANAIKVSAGDSVTKDGVKQIATTADPAAAKTVYDDINKLAAGNVVKIGTGTDAKTYTIVDSDGDEDLSAFKATKDTILSKIKDGDTVEMATAVAGLTGTNAKTVIGNIGSDGSDSDVITAKQAYAKMAEELKAASSIGTDTAAEVTNNGNGKFTIKQGSVEVKDGLSFNLHVGADADMTNKITVNIDAMDAAGLGIKGINVSDNNGSSATYAIDAIADAIEKVSSQRSALGAVQNRLEHTIANLDNVVENTTAAESRIRDTDMAEEMVTYSKNNILAQAGQSMLAQANQSNQGVLSLLQ